MSTNFVAKGDIVTVPAPAAVSSGDGVLVGGLFGVAQTDAGSGAPVALVTQGVFDLPAEGSGSGQDIAVGGTVYWDNASQRCTKTSASNYAIGVAVAAKASAATTVRVRLGLPVVVTPGN